MPLCERRRWWLRGHSARGPASRVSGATFSDNSGRACKDMPGASPGPRRERTATGPHSHSGRLDCHRRKTTGISRSSPLRGESRCYALSGRELRGPDSSPAFCSPGLMTARMGDGSQHADRQTSLFRHLTIAHCRFFHKVSGEADCAQSVRRPALARSQHISCR